MKFVNNNEFKADDYGITAAEGIERRRAPQGPIFLDVRDSNEYHKEHLAGASLLPLEFLENHLMQLPPFAQIITYSGDSDDHAIEAVKTLHDNGFNDIAFVKGGLPALLSAIKADDKEVFLADLPQEEWQEVIERILNERVRPALAADGGGLDVVRVQGDQLFINYRGACSGCASSTTGTLRFIQGTLRVALNHDIEVITAEV